MEEPPFWHRERARIQQKHSIVRSCSAAGRLYDGQPNHLQTSRRSSCHQSPSPMTPTRSVRYPDYPDECFSSDERFAHSPASVNSLGSIQSSPYHFRTSRPEMNEFVARNSVDSIRNEYAGLGHSDDLDRTFGSCSNRRLSTMQAITDGIPLANYVPIAEWERLEARNKELEEFALESAQTIKSLFDALQKSKDNEKKALEQYEKVLQLSVGLNKDNPKELQEKAASIENIAMQRLIESEKTVKSALEKLDELEGYVFSLECEVEDKMKLLEENGMTSQEELRKKENFFKSTEESLCKNLASERALREEMSNVLSESLVLISDLIQNPQVAAKAPKSTA